jgi:hypothetical protein
MEFRKMEKSENVYDGLKQIRSLLTSDFTINCVNPWSEGLLSQVMLNHVPYLRIRAFSISPHHDISEYGFLQKANKTGTITEVERSSPLLPLGPLLFSQLPSERKRKIETK